MLVQQLCRLPRKQVLQQKLAGSRSDRTCMLLLLGRVRYPAHATSICTVSNGSWEELTRLGSTSSSSNITVCLPDTESKYISVAPYYMLAAVNVAFHVSDETFLSSN